MKEKGKKEFNWISVYLIRVVVAAIITVLLIKIDVLLLASGVVFVVSMLPSYAFIRDISGNPIKDFRFGGDALMQISFFIYILGGVICFWGINIYVSNWQYVWMLVGSIYFAIMTVPTYLSAYHFRPNR